MSQATPNCEILYFTDGFLFLQWRNKILKIRASFAGNNNSGTFSGTIDNGPTNLLTRSVTVKSSDLICAHIYFKPRKKP